MHGLRADSDFVAAACGVLAGVVVVEDNGVGTCAEPNVGIDIGAAVVVVSVVGGAINDEIVGLDSNAVMRLSNVRTASCCAENALSRMPTVA